MLFTIPLCTWKIFRIQVVSMNSRYRRPPSWHLLKVYSERSKELLHYFNPSHGMYVSYERYLIAVGSDRLLHGGIQRNNCSICQQETIRDSSLFENCSSHESCCSFVDAWCYTSFVGCLHYSITGLTEKVVPREPSYDKGFMFISLLLNPNKVLVP